MLLNRGFGRPLTRLFGLMCAVALCVSATDVRAAQAFRHVHAGTMLLRGTMTSQVTMTMHGALSVGTVTDLTWDLPLPTSVNTPGYSEQVQNVSYTFDISPNSVTSARDDLGRAVRRFYWARPPANTVIHVTEVLQATVQSSLAPFHAPASYPLTDVPSSIRNHYLNHMTQMLELPRHATATALPQFSAGARSEKQVVSHVADWVATHLHYSLTRLNGPFDARSILRDRLATCRGYADLMSGILRRLNIPSRTMEGWVSAQPLRIAGSGGPLVQWSRPGSQGEAHDWLEVYFPGTGWVQFDPQREKFFVDVRHIAMFTSTDAGDPHIGAWSARYAEGASPTGPALANGTAEIVPGDGSVPGSVTVQTQDSVHVWPVKVVHDVRTLMLFAP